MGGQSDVLVDCFRCNNNTDDYNDSYMHIYHSLLSITLRLFQKRVGENVPKEHLAKDVCAK